jgi:SAM-dependent methyltransferase
MTEKSPPPNEAERRRWNDARWVDQWPKRERLTTSVSPKLMEMAALQEGERVLDIGCGAGGTSMISAEAVGSSGSVVGADISDGLVELARTRTADAGIGNATYLVADMQTAELDAVFDIALSQFGVMFFDEPSAAFANIRRHVRPGGRLVFACWQNIDRNPWHTSPALRSFVPEPRVPAAGKSPTGPFVLADPEETTDILSRAGFEDVRFTGFDLTVDGPADAVIEESLFGFMGIADRDVDQVRLVMDAHLRQFEMGPDFYRFPLSFWIVEAINP